jgi:hypothetical protein
MMLYENGNVLPQAVLLLAGAAVHVLIVFLLLRQWMKRTA